LYNEYHRPILDVRGVSKSYSRNAARGFLRSYLRSVIRPREEDTFHAVKSVSFSLWPGEGLAIIGPNGAGKTTLLELIAGISSADSGTIETNGTVAALLELGSGFHPDLSGKENVFLNASLVGLSRKTTVQRFDEIVEFSGIGDFINEPLRTYSTGMVVRLAFSVAVHLDPDILIIDEAFAVGDREFQTKCAEKIYDFRRAGKTMICVSHQADVLRRLCDQAIWLDHGEVVMAGPAEEIMEAYQSGSRAHHAGV
jgi:ABC-type polysaccharide/polyol phosphate transport system ATPase subunit